MASNNASIAITAVDLTRQAFDSVNGNLEKMQKTFNLIGKVAVFSIIADSIKAIIARTLDAEKAQLALQATLRATGGVAGRTEQQLGDLAEKIKGSSIFDDDDIRKAEVALLRFRNVQGEVFDDAIQAIANLATTDGDITHWAQVFGKAVEDPVGGLKGLRKEGINLTDAQEGLIRSFERVGNKAGTAKVLIEAINASMGGAAAGQKKGLVGATADAAHAYDDFLKTLGKSKAYQEPTSSFFNFLTQSLKDIDNIMSADFLDKIKGIALFAAGFRGFKLDSADKNRDLAKNSDAAKLTESADQFIKGQQAAEKKVKDINEAAAAESKRSNAVKAELAQVAVTRELQIQKQGVEQSLQLLEFQKDRGTVGIKSFYDQRLIAIQTGLNAEVAAVDKAIKAEQQKRQDAQASFEPDKSDAATVQIAKLNVTRDKLLSDLKHAPKENNEKFKVEYQAFLDDLTQQAVDLENLVGIKTEGALRAFDLAHKKIKEQIQSNLDQPKNQEDYNAASRAQDQIDAQREQLGFITELSEKQEQYGLLQDQLANRESEIQDARESGQIGELEALRETDDARKASLGPLREVYEQLKQISSTIIGPEGEKARQGVANLGASLDSLAASANQAGSKFRSVFEDSFVSAMDRFSDSSLSAGEAFASFARDVAKGLQHIATQKLAEQIFGGISGGANSGVAGGIGAFLTKIYGGSANSAGTNAAFAAPQARAGGGSVDARSMYLVGESGPELLYTGNQSGNVIPNHMLGGGGMNFNQVVNVAPGTDPGTLSRVMFLAKEQAKRELTDAWRRGTGPRTR